MSAKLEIDVRLRTDEAASNADKLKNDLNEVKTAANTPAKVRVDTTDAQKRITDIKTALREVQLAPGLQSAIGGALQEISQEARNLSMEMVGTKKAVADMGISMGLAAANALGPWGQLVAGVVGAIGMMKRLELQQIAELNTARQLQEVQGNLGARYNALSQNIAATATAQERLTIINQRVAESFRAQVTLANQLTAAYSQSGVRTSGLTAAAQADRDAQILVRAAENALPAIQRLRGANISLNDVLNDQGGLLRRLGINFQQTGNAAQDTLNRTAALAEITRQQSQQNVERLRREAEEAERRVRRLRRDGEEADAIRQRASEAASRLAVGEAALSQATRDAAEAQRLATAETERATTAARDAARAEAELEEKTRRAAAAASAASAQDLREARRRIFEVVAETQFDERMRVIRAGTDERQRATQEYRNLVAEETYRQQQSMRSVQLGQLEQDLTRTRRQAGENEAQRQQRLAEAQSRYNQVRREALEAEDAEAARRREQREQEKTEAMETANAVRAAFDTQLQGRQQLIQAEEAQRQARVALGNASLTQEQQEQAAFRQAMDSLPAIRAQIDIVNQRIAAAREHAASETEINRLIIERMALETQAMNVQAQATAQRQRSIGPIENYKDAMVESGHSINQAMTSAAAAAIFAGENVGEALQKALASTLQNIAIESAVKAVLETARGLSALAMGSPGAALHFAAAGKFAATAVVAGTAGAAIAPSTASATATGAGAPAAAPRAESPTRRESEEGGGAKVINISLNAFQSNEQAQNLIVRSLREAGYNGRDATIRR